MFSDTIEIGSVIEAFSSLKRNRGWTIREAASKLNVDAAYLARVENRAQNPSKKLLVQMFEILVSHQAVNVRNWKLK